ncbi:uncharacterized protein [Rutidosis leptorrhynchoides]|uniref:uncharacterized protein n=1 Tax=Rutidosis leptorrhynchoides TaxID=125765 RepID=UPI003A9929D8
MELKNIEITPSQDLVCTNESDFEQENRTYSCTFCKRGFSNAQALGGHMNVHRKDRAKLQESIQETLITKQTTKGINLMDHADLKSSSDEKSDGVPKRPWTCTEEINSPESPRKKDRGVHVNNFKKPSLQLSLRIESSLTSDMSSIISNRTSFSSSSPTELDLELRLGTDSHVTSRDHVILE